MALNGACVSDSLWRTAEGQVKILGRTGDSHMRFRLNIFHEGRALVQSDSRLRLKNVRGRLPADLLGYPRAQRYNKVVAAWALLDDLVQRKDIQKVHGRMKGSHEHGSQIRRRTGCKGLSCPRPMVVTMTALKKMDKGKTLKVTANDSSVKHSIPSFCQRSGYALMERSEENGSLLFFHYSEMARVVTKRPGKKEVANAW